MTKQQRFRVNEKKVQDYETDPQNLNRGSRRGKQMSTKSYQEYGAGRSWLADQDGMLIAGNQARQAAIEAVIEDVIEIEVLDPNIQVVVKRPDLDLDSPQDDRGRRLAAADNRARDVAEWDPTQVIDQKAMLLDAELFRQDEIDDLLNAADAEALIDQAVQNDGHRERDKLTSHDTQLKLTVEVKHLDVIERAILLARQLAHTRRRDICLETICQYYIDSHTDAELEALLESDDQHAAEIGNDAR